MTKAKPQNEPVQQSFDSVYRSCFAHVARSVRALGASDADVDDLTQEVFIIVRRKLPQFDGRNLSGFLYRIAQRTVRDYRRSAWFRHVFANRAPLHELTSPGLNGLQVVQEGERQEVIEAVLERMSEKLRSTFVLFEVEGYSGEEIAQMQSLPLSAVWVRLHRARKDFVRMVSEALPEEGER